MMTINLSGVIKFISAAVLFLILSSCRSYDLVDNSFLSDGRYDMAYPSGNISEHIVEINKSVKLINSIAFYKQYLFDQSDSVRSDRVSRLNLKEEANKIKNFNKTSSGTATITGIKENSILFLTCAHVVDYGDTLITYFSNKRGQKTDIIESVSVKQSQSNYVAASGISNLEIFIKDAKKDIAFMVGSIEKSTENQFAPFGYKIGNSLELEWGNIIYAIGYPMHNKMITSGITSIPENEDDFFIADINVNRGSSGGIVLALRDGIPNFELVGIISWVPAEKVNVLAPVSLENNTRYQIDAKYEGDVFIEELENVKYGVARIVSIEAIKKVVDKFKGVIDSSSYNFELFKK